jgi:hypothetical protein
MYLWVDLPSISVNGPFHLFDLLTLIMAAPTQLRASDVAFTVEAWQYVSHYQGPIVHLDREHLENPLAPKGND